MKMERSYVREIASVSVEEMAWPVPKFEVNRKTIHGIAIPLQ